MKEKFIRFLLIGGVNTAFGYGCFAIFIFFGLHYSVALLLSTILGILFNFKTIGIFVFKSPDNNLIFRFALIYFVTYSVNLLGLALFDYFGVVAYIGGAVLILPMAVLAFALQRRFVFKNE